MLVDSHCHLDQLNLAEYSNNLDLLLQQTKSDKVEHILCVAITLKNTPDVIAIAEKYDWISASVGLHPNEEVEQEPSDNDYLKYATHPSVVAIGETGLDYYRTQGSWQQERFRRQIRLARDLNLPLIIHTRDAEADTLRILREEKADAVGGVLHCFTGSLAFAKAGIDLGFYISFSGIVTFQNARHLQQIAIEIPLTRMLIETDAPYLAPMPYRGKPNQPSWVRFVAEKIAQLRQVSYEEVAKITTNNFYTAFPRANPGQRP